MKYKILSVVLLIILLVSFSAYALNFTPEEMYNSVVVVYTKTGVGSGFSIKENIIMTNAHVVGNNKNVDVNLYNGETLKGTVIKTDDSIDLALIEVDKSIASLKINEDDLSIGQEVYAIGAPKDMPYTMTKGIISALDRQIGQNTYIQIDASVNSGNSGGPLLDETGNVIGIITLKASDAEGIGFAINASDILSFMDDAEKIPKTTLDEDEDSNEDEDSMDNKQEEKNSDIIKLSSENEILKITVIVLSVLLVLSLLVILKLLIRKKDNDEFDFEIEIEE